MIDISIPMRFGGPQPRAYGAGPATSSSCEAGDIVGDTRRGGSCNFEQFTLIPHCNGTHTECVGHITNKRIAVTECLRDVLIPAVLVTVDTLTPREVDEIYTAYEPGDRLIGRATLQAAFKGEDVSGAALILRTLPNGDDKLSAVYDSATIPPYFTTEAMELIVERGFNHLLVDMPSIDRLFDGGKLSNHRIFWGVEPGSFELNPRSRVNSTITELIYVPNDVADGEYLLNLQIPPFVSDAAPSRPILLPR